MALPSLPPTPLVSVLTANHNYAKFIGRAIESVLAQSYPHLELLVCDDGSSDTSTDVIERYVARDSRVSLLRNPRKGGMASAWNALYARSFGHIICLLDADDLFECGKLEAIVRAFRDQGDTGLLVHRLLIVDADNEPIQEIPYLGRFEQGWLADRVLSRGGRWRYMPSSAVSLRRELADRIFPLPEHTFTRSAEAFIVTLGPLLAKVGAVDTVLARYTVHGSNYMGRTSRTTEFFDRVIDASERTAAGVNQRLRETALPATIDLRRNLDYVQAVFCRALLRGEPRRTLLPSLRRMASVLVGDDAYGFWQKTAALVVYIIAVALPTAWRTTWLTGTLGPNRRKGWVQRTLNLFKTSAPRGAGSVTATAFEPWEDERPPRIRISTIHTTGSDAVGRHS